MVIGLLLAACAGDPKDPTTADTGPPDSGTSDTPDTGGDPTDTGPAGPDADGDGSPDDQDCDDADSSVYPGAPDPCGDDRVTDCSRTTDDHRATVDGGATFDALDAALAASSPGATITVCRGTWTGALVSPVPVHLVAHHGAAETVLDAERSGTVLSLPGDSSVTGFTVTGGRTGGDGGGIAMTSPGTLAVTGCTLADNRADRGGGIALAEGSTATVTGSEIRDNQAEGGGGALVPAEATLELVDSTVSGNVGTTYGGGIVLLDGATLIGGSVTGNDAPFPIPFYGQPSGGGGVSAFGAATISGTDIAQNTGVIGAGVAVAHGSFTLTDVTVRENLAPYGIAAGLWIYHADAVLLGATEIVDNTTTGASVGGVYVESGSITGGRVARNTAEYRCGGGWFANATATGVAIEENTAQEVAGLCVGPAVTVDGGRIAGNVAAGAGGGIGAIGGAGNSVTLTGGVEIVDNQADAGAGMWLEGTAATVFGGWVLRNVAATDGGGAWVSTDGTLVSEGADWGEGGDDNLPDDVSASGSHAFGAGSTFSCTAVGCDGG